LPADANQIEQVVVNLLINAADAIGEDGGTIRIGTRAVAEPAPGFAEIFVADNGRGIPAEHLDRLFEPFFTTKGPRGTGLGLAVTWGIVEAHGGTIEVESEPGRGTGFTVRLPYAADSSSEAAAAARPDAERGARSVAVGSQAAHGPVLGPATGRLPGARGGAA
jgi:two-component system NtrC family sensor kinase